MLRICLTICSHVDFGQPGEVDTRCVGVNYDEHGEARRGHCHLQTALRLTTADEPEWGGAMERLGGMCVNHPPLTSRAQCNEGGVLEGTQGCGRSNYAALFCHFSDGDGVGRAPSPGRRCVAGEGYDNSTGSCSACAAGSFGLLEEEPRPLRALIPRPPDSPSAVPRCVSCPPGRFCRRRTSCVYGEDPASCPPRCPVGHRCEAGSSQPEPCPMGSFQDEEGATHCKRCATGATLGEGSASHSQCICPDGHRRISLASSRSSANASCEGAGGGCAGSACVPCGEGMECEWGGYMAGGYMAGGEGEPPLSLEAQLGRLNSETLHQTRPDVLPGFWASKEEPLLVLRCDSKRTHPDCVGGDATEEQLCLAPREGRLCAECEEGMRVISAGGCGECDLPSDVGRVVGFSLLVIVLLYAVHRLCNRLDSTDKLSRIGALGAVGLLLEFAQAVSCIYQLKLEWGPPFSDMIRVLRAVVFQFDLLRLPCLVSDDPLVSLLVRLLSPLVLLLTFALIFAADRYFRPSERRALSTSTESASLLRTQPRYSLNALFNTSGLILLTMYTSIALATFSPFICFDQPDGTSYNTNYPSVQCWSSDGPHYAMVGLASGFILIYPVAALCGCVAAAACYKRALIRDPDFSRRFRFLFGRSPSSPSSSPASSFCSSSCGRGAPPPSTSSTRGSQSPCSRCWPSWAPRSIVACRAPNQSSPRCSPPSSSPPPPSSPSCSGASPSPPPSATTSSSRTTRAERATRRG